MTVNNTTITQSGLLPNTAYTVWVRGIDAAGNPSDWSQAFPFTTVKDTVAPGDPTNIAADFTSSSVVMTWNPPLQVPADFQDYEITFSKSDNSSPVSFFTVNPRFTFTFQDNVNAFSSAQSTVKVTVKSRDKSGNKSAGAFPSLVNGVQITTPDGLVANPAPSTTPTISVSPLTNSYSVAITSTNAPVDSAGVEILQYAAATGGTGTSKWKGTDSTAVITATAGTTVYVTARYVDVFGQNGSETARSSVTPTSSVNIDTTPPALPTNLAVTSASDSADITGSTGIATLTWTAPTDLDLAEYLVYYGTTSGASDFNIIIPAPATTAKIYGLNSSTTYYFKIKTKDTSGNLNASFTSVVNTTIPRDASYGNGSVTPATPVGSRNNTKILITHTLNDNTGTARLPLDTVRLEFHISTANGFTPSTATVFQVAPVEMKAGTSYTGYFDYLDGSASLGTRYLRVIAYDAAGNPSLASAQATITNDLTLPIFASSIIAGDAQIGSLSANKIVADSVFTNNLNVQSDFKIGTSATTTASGTSGTPTLTVTSATGIYPGQTVTSQTTGIQAATLVQSVSGTTVTLTKNLSATLTSATVNFNANGTMQSGNYVSGSTGWKIGYDGANNVFEINQGIIKASTLQLQTASNMLRMEHSVFNKPGAADSLLTNSLTTKALLYGSNITSATVVEDTTANPAGNYALQLTASSGTNPSVRFTPYDSVTDATKHYLTLVKGESYIVSGWFKADTTRACSFTLYDGTTTSDASITGDVAGTTFSVTTTWTRFSQVISWSPSTGNAGDIFIGSLILKIPSSSVVSIKGLQLERKIGTVNLPSNYVIPGGTVISGSSIRTGSIASSNYGAGTGWAIDLSGNAEFNNATVRGAITANSGFIGGVYGWKIQDNLISNSNVGIYAPKVTTRTNLIVNPTFDGATTATTFWTSSNATPTLDSTKQYSGISSLKLTPSGTSSVSISTPTSGTTMMAVLPSLPYVASIYANAVSTTARNVSMTITWYDASKTALSTTTATTVSIVSNDGWKRFDTGVQISPSTAAYASVNVSYASASTADIINFDAALFENSGFLDTYFDGSYSEASWSGAISNSISTAISSIDGKLRYNYVINPSFEFAELSATTSAASGTMTYTMASPHGLTVGSSYIGQVYGSSVNGYNGPYTLTAATATTLTTSGSGTGTSTGTKILIGWQLYNSITATHSTVSPFSGTNKLIITSIGGANATDSGITTKFTAEKGQTYTASAYFRADNFADTASATVGIQFVWPDSTTSTASTQTINQRDGWIRVSHTATAPTTASTGQTTVRFITIYKGGVSSTAPGNVAIDAALVEKTLTANPYFDGSSDPGASWSSLTNMSNSINYETTFYAGSADRSNAPFMVKYDGSIYATNATIQGNIKATSGLIGSDQLNAWNISSDGIFYQNSTVSNLNLLYPTYDPNFDTGGLYAYWNASGTVDAAAEVYVRSTTQYANTVTGNTAAAIGVYGDGGVSLVGSSYKFTMYKTNGTSPVEFSISGATPDIAGITPGTTTIAFSAYILPKSSGTTSTVTIVCTGGASNISTTSGTLTAGTFTKVTATGVVPANTTSIRFEITNTGSTSGTARTPAEVKECFVIDKVSLAIGSTTSEIDSTVAFSTYLRSNQSKNPFEIVQGTSPKFSIDRDGKIYSSGINGDTLVISGQSSTNTLRITSIDPVGVSSTTHGLQVGPSTSNNLRFSGSSIESVKNGATASLKLNASGQGTVQIGASLFVTTASIFTNANTAATYMTTGRIKSFSSATVNTGDVAHEYRTSNNSATPHVVFSNNNVSASAQIVGSIVTSGAGTNFNTTSDYRVKEDIVAIDSPITKIMSLNPVNFKFIGNGNTRVDGFIAHEVQAILPYAVTGNKDEVDELGNNVLQSMDSSRIVPVLTAALQEAVAKIDQLELRLAALENK